MRALNRIQLVSLLIGLVGCSPHKPSTETSTNLPVPKPVAKRFSERSGNELNACLVSVCGPAKSNRSGYDTESESPPSSPHFMKVWQESFQQRTEEAVRIEIDLNQTLLKAYKSYLEDPKLDPDLDQEAMQAYIAASVLIERLMRSISQIIEMDSQGVFINPKALSKAVDEKTILLEPANRLVNKILLPLYKAIQESHVSPNDRLGIRLAFSQKGRPVEEAIKSDASVTKKRIEKIRSRIGQSFLESLNIGKAVELLVDKAASTGRLDEIEGHVYGDRAFSLEITEIALDPDNLKVFANVVGNLDDYLKEVFKSVSIEDLVPQRPNLDVEIEAIVCRMKMNRTILLDDKAKERTGQIIGAVKAATKVIGKRYLSNQTDLQKFENAVDGVKHSFVSQTAHRLKEFDFYLRNQTDGSKYLSEFLRNKGKGWKTLALFEILNRSTGVLYDSSTSRMPFRKACDDLGSMKPTDGAGLNDQIVVSAFTAITHELTTPIVAHEFGHLMSSWLRQLSKPDASSSVFEKNLTCIANRNPFVDDPKPMTAFMNTTWSEEDLADYFSNQIVEYLKLQNDDAAKASKPLGCAMIVDMGDHYTTANRLEPRTGDKHSSGLMRLLLGISDTNSVTSECKPFLDDIAKTGRQLRCEL